MNRKRLARLNKSLDAFQAILDARGKPVSTVATFCTADGRGTFDVRRDPHTGHLVCNCNVKDCDHLPAAALAASAGVMVTEDGARFELLGTFASNSGHGLYDVKRERHAGALSCNCRGFIYHKRCWHLRAVSEAGA